MTMEFPQDDPKAKVIEFKSPRRPDFEAVRTKWDGCKHIRVFVGEEKREVTCQECGALLDAFGVLLELANRQRRWLQELDQWDAYRESRLSDRYDEKWERDHEGITSPPNDPALLQVWNTFRSVIGERFCRMYMRKQRKRNGPNWYGVSTDGGCLSYEYARSKMIPKVAGGEK